MFGIYKFTTEEDDVCYISEKGETNSVLVGGLLATRPISQLGWSIKNIINSPFVDSSILEKPNSDLVHSRSPGFPYYLHAIFSVRFILCCSDARVRREVAIYAQRGRVTYGGDVLQTYLEKDARSLHARRQIKSPHMEVFSNS